MNSTLNYYEKNAQQFVEQTVNVNMQSITASFIASLPSVPPKNQHILDVGCGSGRDSYFFAKQGCNVTAIDGSQTLINLAKASNNSIYGINWQCLNFSDLATQNWNGSFTGIWACASLLHIPYAELPSLINILLDMLTDEGAMYASFKYGDSERMHKARFFCDLNEDRWAIIKNQLDKYINDTVWITQDKRVDKDDEWLNVLIKPF